MLQEDPSGGSKDPALERGRLQVPAGSSADL